jgi:hypothetical protein
MRKLLLKKKLQHQLLPLLLPLKRKRFLASVPLLLSQKPPFSEKLNGIC